MTFKELLTVDNMLLTIMLIASIFLIIIITKCVKNKEEDKDEIEE